MDQARYERFTRQWTADAARDPKNARAAANRFANSVMWVPFAILLVIAAVMGVGALVMMIPWVAAQAFGGLVIATGLFICGVIVSGLPGSIPEPRGVVITKGDAGLLFERVNRAAKALEIKPPSVIRLDEADEVLVTWYGKRGFSGRGGHLRVGLATIAMLEQDEFDSVITLALAHMLPKDAAHLRNVQHAHAWWSAIERKVEPKIAAQGNAWEKAYSWLLSMTLGACMLAIVPRLAGMETTFWREREMASDRIAVSKTSRVATARALVRAQVRARWWRTEVAYQLDAAQRRSATPEAAFAISAASAAGGEIAPSVTGSVMFARALTEPDDPHAANTPIGKRVSAVGMGIDRPGVEQVTFAEAAAWAAAPASGQLWNATFPTGNNAKALQKVGAEWVKRHGAQWREAHALLAELDQKGGHLAAEANARPMRADQYLMIAGWARSRYGREVARDWLRYATHVDPFHAPAALELGRELVANGDPGGVGWLEHAANLAPDLADEGQAWVAAWHRACGDQPGANARVDRRGKLRQELRQLKWTPFEQRQKARVSMGSIPTERERNIVRGIAAEFPSIALAAIARHDMLGVPMGKLPMTIAIEFQAGTSEDAAATARDSFARALDRAFIASKIDQPEVVFSIRDNPNYKMWTDIRNAGQTHVWDPADEARRAAAGDQMATLSTAVVPAAQAAPAQQQPMNTPIQPALPQQQAQADPAAPLPGQGTPVPSGLGTPVPGQTPADQPLPGHGTPVPGQQSQQPPAEAA